MNKLILIMGDLAVGKSTMAKKLATKMNVAFYTKDKLKEVLADDIGFNNREENKKLSVAAISVMKQIFISNTLTNNDLILEANFHLNELKAFDNLANEYGYKLIVINVEGNIDELFKKFTYRMNNENRHKAHLTADIVEYDKYKKYIVDSRCEVEEFPKNTIIFNGDYEKMFNDALKVIL